MRARVLILHPKWQWYQALSFAKMTSFTCTNMIWNLLGPIYDMGIKGDIRVSSHPLLIAVVPSHTPSQSCTEDLCGRLWNFLKSGGKAVFGMFINALQETLCSDNEFQQCVDVHQTMGDPQTTCILLIL